jgi:integrase
MPGSVKKRAKDSWTVTYDLGPDPATGRRRQRRVTVRGTKREAEAELVRLIHERDRGIERPADRLSVEQYLARWMRDSVEITAAPRTIQTYREIIAGRLVPAFGPLPLQSLRPPQIQALYARWLREGRADGKGGLSARSVLRYHQVLHAALHQAVRWQLLVANPCDAIDPPRAPRRELRATSAGDVNRLLEAADAEGIGSLARAAVLTGMRRGELLGLRWSDVDLEAGQVAVQQTAQRITGQGVVFRQPKTRLSRRAIALSPATVQLLRRHRRDQLEARLAAGSAYQDLGLVFGGPLGGPLDAGHLTRAWNRAVERAGVGPVRWHDLRHAHATLLLQQGIHPKIVSERLGHASIAITLDTYSHVLPGLQASAAVALDAVLEEPAQESVTNL